jgi:hypothetical protein
MASGYFKAAYENVPGTEVNNPTLSTKVIYVPVITSKPDLAPDPMERDDELRGLDEPLPVIPESYAPKWDKTLRGYPDSIGFFLKALLGAPTSTAGNGIITDAAGIPIPTGATRHVWTAPFFTGSTPQTFEGIWAYKDQGVFFKIKGCGTDTIAFETPDKGGMSVKVSGPGMYMQRISDPALSPAYESLAIRPFLKAGLKLTWLTGAAVVQDFTLNATAPVEATRTLGAGSKFPDLMEKGDGLIVFSGSVNSRSLDQDDWDAVLNSTGFSAVATWLSDTFITGSYAYKLFVTMSNVQLTGGDVDDLSNKRRLGANYNFKATNAGSASVTVQLVNATASYA